MMKKQYLSALRCGSSTSYSMNQSKQEPDSYYECPMGQSMTPTMVSNFNLPNSNVNKDGPYLKILEQPQTKFRFRYKSEMAGTHGQLKAESSDKNKNVFPTVQLCNWKGGPALIRLMLYTAEDNANERKRHVHELSGKNCNKEGFTGGCEVVVDEENSYTAHKMIPSFFQMKEEAEEEARNMDLNKVVLRFQTFFFDTKANFYRPITEYVDSDVIFNLKNASTGELKIVRISAVSSPCTGGTEVWMLVEKVKKNNVRIKFYELDKDNQEVWKGYGEFKESDVHHQYAIVFRTPAYRYSNIREPVNVKIQLERTTDNDTSEPLDFTFLPENLKRSNAFLDTQMEMENYPQKRVRHGELEAIDLKRRSPLFLGSRDVKQPYSPEAPPFQSPPHMVPSPITPADSPSSVGFYSPPHHGSHNPSITVSNSEEIMLLTSNSEDGMNMPVENHVNHQIGHVQQSNPSFQFVFGTEGGQIHPLEAGDQSSFYHNNYPNQSVSPYYFQAPSPSSNSQGSPHGGSLSPFSQGDVSPGHSMSTTFSEQGYSNPESDNALAQIQQFDAVQKQVMNSKKQINNSDLLSIIGDSRLFTASKDFGDIQADSVSSQSVAKDVSSDVKKDEVESLTNKMSKVTVDEESKERKQSTDSGKPNSVESFNEKELAYRVGITAANCLQSYAATGNINLLLAANRYLLTVQNEHGDNALHIAIQNKNKETFTKLLNASRKMYCTDLLGAQNYDGETPLHLAVRAEDTEMVKYLLMSPGCNINATDVDGNTALHLASKRPVHHILSAILAHPLNGKKNTASKSINLYNHNGQTPLHIAATVGNLESVKLLLKSGALIHLCERKQGANPLHLAVLLGHHGIAKYLIENTSITVDARLLDGNTALHIAAQIKDTKMCSLLMDGKANPYAKNSIRKGKNLSEDEDEEDEDETETQKSRNTEEEEEEEEDPGYFTPIDYAEDDPELLAILKGSQTGGSNENLSNHSSTLGQITVTASI
ncbi:Nuclear factor subunit [Armadillidium nasatum]|uniref:Nuclear factor subunit n=1 Tax=Armadillidium nasatum TaxID=96803 RepID=A0A5N5ST03_9CRUS|nr:Nuclear factor subunit [Armadillidium nasatum]